MNAPSKVWDRGRNVKGKVIGIIHQPCAACERVQEKLIAKWPNGKKTYLCPQAVEHDDVDTIHVV
jgi:hypothetical protein